LQAATGSANNEVCDFLEAGHRHANAAMVANAVDDLAVVVDLPQLALGVMFIAAMDHQIIHDNSLPGPDPECVFYELMGLHKTPFTSIKLNEYMQ
jgi:hypothetical protein